MGLVTFKIQLIMKKIFIAFCILSIQFGYTQNEPYLEKVKSIDSIIHNLYNVISGEKGEERDWELMKYLFHKDAKLIPSGLGRDSIYRASYITADQYIESSGKWLIENGFYEKEIHRETNVFGNIAQVFTTYEAFHSESDEQPFMRGINSIQLLYDNERWWIINIYWSQETKNNPIPKRYLPK